MLRASLSESQVVFDNQVIELSATARYIWWVSLHTAPCCCTLVYEITYSVYYY